jgi:uncharacterized protein YjcR
MWMDKKSVEEIAQAFGCSPATVYKWPRLYGWPSRRRKSGGVTLLPPDPTEAEIYGPLTEAIRAQWSPEEAARRAGAGAVKPAEIRVVHLPLGVRKAAGI